ncbi:MAG: hypothetical protein FD164_801 [Nitrospirae bacterium]|nr:MAG: hypothetical protein FD164_801 [Nitrospirota bacterium]
MRLSVAEVTSLGHGELCPQSCTIIAERPSSYLATLVPAW